MNQQKNKKVHFGVNFLTPEDQSHIFYFSLSSYLLIKIVALLQSEHKDKVMFTILNVLTIYKQQQLINVYIHQIFSPLFLKQAICNYSQGSRY